MFRLKSAPAFSEWPPMIQERLSATDREFWTTVRSTARPWSLMLTGRFAPAVNWKEGKPRRPAEMLGGFSRPSWAVTSALMKVLCREDLS